MIPRTHMQLPDTMQVIDLGNLPYEAAYSVQASHHESVLTARTSGTPEVGRLLLVEHDPPVITISRRKGAHENLLATDAMLDAAGVTIAQTDRGGDITYHGPGQLVVYPITDLNALGFNLHAYLRFLEGVVIDVCQHFGISASRDESATGVWVSASADDSEGPSRKICAIGIRVRKWVTMHGFALNVTTDLDHFGLIVPCGLAGRPVTSLQAELADACPSMEQVKKAVVQVFQERVAEQISSR